jgi:uncharacterized protein YkwD
MPRHARTSGTAGHRTAAGKRGRGGLRPARTALVAGCTLLAAGAGGVFSGALPAPPGLPKSLLVAGDPAASYGGPVPAGQGSTGRTPAPDPARTSAPGGASASGSGTSGGSSAPAGDTGAGAGSAASGGTGSSAASGGAASATGRPRANGGGGGTAADTASTAATVRRLVNEQRAKHGCGSLADSPALSALASALSGEMSAEGFFGHTDPAGRTPWKRADAAGITNLGGENIARGQPTAEAVMAAWMRSPGHRANILDCSYHSLGVGVAYGPDGPWWTQDFGF